MTTMTRRPLTTLLAATALLVGACSGEDAATTGPTVTATAPDATADPAPGDTTGATPDPSTVTDRPVGEATATTVPADAAAATADPDEVEGGAEGQAAADRAKAFLVALVTADASACTMLLSFSDPALPMTDVEPDLERCRTELPATMAATVEAQGLAEEDVAALETMRVTGADVQGDVAVVDEDNYSPLFADAMGDSTITLRKIDDEWYLDLDAFLETP